MKKTTLILLSILFLAGMTGSTFRPEPQHIRGWFKDAYTWMFSRPGQLRIAGKSFGRFTGGFKGLLLYGGITSILEKELQQRGEHYRKNDFYDLSPIGKIAGLPLFRKKVPKRWSGIFGHSNRFSRYNPAIIRWGIACLIPNPDMKVDGISCRRIYRKIFARFFRLLVESRRILTGRNQLDRESAAYLTAMKTEDFNALRYLDGRFGTLLLKYMPEKDNSAFSPAMAFGFWIRRHIDGTDTLLWEGLRKFMRLYDREWLDKKTGK